MPERRDIVSEVRVDENILLLPRHLDWRVLAGCCIVNPQIDLFDVRRPRTRPVPSRSSPQLPKAMSSSFCADLLIHGQRAPSVVNCRLPLPVALREMMIGSLSPP